MTARSDNAPVILDARGEPITPNRARALAPGGNAPYDAADNYGAHVAAWQPYLYSPDGELNMYRDRIVARVRDLVRNDGWASGAVTRILDNAIGGHYRPLFRPDYRALAAYTGKSTFDAQWAHEFGRVAEAHYRSWAFDPNHYCDAQRNLTFPQMMRLAFRHKLVDGDGLAQMVWLPDRIGLGRARYATAVQILDPDRLSNPQLRFDSADSRGGVQIDRYGAAHAYWIRKAHQGDWWAAADSVTWESIPRETDWGRPIIVHDFDHDRAGQHRGGAGIFTPILQRMRMLAKMDSTELDAAVINSMFGAYLESPFDPQLVEQAIGDSVEMSAYQTARSDFHADRRTMLGDVKVPILFPGEKINTVKAERPNSNFAQFEKVFLRNFSAATGLSSQQFSQDWSDTNYSSARGALLEAFKTLKRRQADFSTGFAQPVVGCWLEESMDVDDYPMPAGAPPFAECRAMYSRAEWMGPARGWIDPVAEKQGSVLGMDAGLSTLQLECMEQGLDYEEVLEQRAREIEKFEELGIPVPTWAGMQVPGYTPASQTISKPEPT
ncbi:phage portal protein [Luteibacter yeojuensis]|uniref:Phage portal protein n=1 Tax=Luteibacter yeojuensis TaxID=345309 RepID=A0A7X5TPF0_9GAMM|nr:phage portal protein [Luteibacter yeojuensis]NID15391.1 phage portal protein [Luteibacter yeojuensis]